MSKVKWIIQDVNVRYDELHHTINALCNLNYNYGTVGVIPFTKEITGINEIIPDRHENEELETFYIFRGATKIISILENIVGGDIFEIYNEFPDDIVDFSVSEPYHQREYAERLAKKLKASIFYDAEKFDQKYYSQFDIELLNKDCEFYKISENLNKSFDEPKFIKPSTDLKAFSGGILEAGQTIEEFINSQTHQAFYIEEDAVIADCVDIRAEYRMFVVDGKIITGSMYKLGDKVQTSNVVPKMVYEFVEKTMKIYEPHDVYTIDVAITQDMECKIVEYNCWNCSGAYDCDLEKTFKAINQYVIGKNKNV